MLKVINIEKETAIEKLNNFMDELVFIEGSIEYEDCSFSHEFGTERGGYTYLAHDKITLVLTGGTEEDRESFVKKELLPFQITRTGWNDEKFDFDLSSEIEDSNRQSTAFNLQFFL